MFIFDRCPNLSGWVGIIVAGVDVTYDDKPHLLVRSDIRTTSFQETPKISNTFS